MLKGIVQCGMGYLVWKRCERGFHITDDCVVLVMPERDEEWNACAVELLPYYMERKQAGRAILFVQDESTVIGLDVKGCRYQVAKLTERKMEQLLKLYCLWHFSDNIVFLYKDKPQDNKASKILQETKISMRELICLGFYHLRKVPNGV